MSASRIPLPGVGPEDVVVDGEGRPIVGLLDGRVVRVDPASGAAEELVNTGGRPLGLEVLPDGRILICDSPKGLLELDPKTRKLRTLVDTYQARPLRFCSNVVAARDGTLYFSTSSARYTIHEWRRDIVEAIPTGAIFRRRPDGQVERLLDGLFFANGLALARDESFLVFAETGAERLGRLWLKGPNEGQQEPFARLAGYPDNLSMSPDGLVWVAMAAPTNPTVKLLHKLPLAVRKLAARLPETLQPKPPRIAWVLAYDPAATPPRVAHEHRLDDGSYSFVTGVCQAGRKVYYGSLAEQSLGVFELPAG